MNNYAPRISRSYDDLSGSVQLWSNIAQRIICGEHYADKQDKTTHVHLGIWASPVKEESLKRTFNSIRQDKLSGTKVWAWSHKKHPKLIDFVIQPEEHDDYPHYWTSTFKYIRYVLKGNAPKFVKCISPEIVERARKSWKTDDPVASVSQPGNVYIINSKKPSKTITRRELLAEMSEIYHEMKDKTQRETVQMCCRVLRKYGFGINLYHVREYYYALVWDDESPFNTTTEKILSIL